MYKLSRKAKVGTALTLAATTALGLTGCKSEPKELDATNVTTTGIYETGEMPSQNMELIETTEAETKLLEINFGIIKEILPNVEFDYSQDVVLYINFASAMKHTDFETYSEAIKRYKRKSPLYMLLIEDKNKERLSDEECDMLREILKMTMNAFNELVEINPNLKFDIIKQISGVKTRG